MKYTRSTFRDEEWGERVYLCERLLAESIDAWSKTEDEFPAESIVAGILYLFSPERRPRQIRPFHLRETFSELVISAEVEYRLAWHSRTLEQAQELIDALSEILTSAISTWQDASHVPSIRELAAVVEREIIAKQYFVIHHYETTQPKRRANRTLKRQP